MRKNKIIKSIFCIVFIFLFCGYSNLTTADEIEDEYVECQRDDYVWEIKDDAVLEKGLHIINKSIYISDNATLTIEPGAKIEFVNDCMGERTQISVLGGRIIADGTAENPIYISRKENYPGSLIYFGNNIYDEDGKVSTFESIFNFVKISKGGTSPNSGGGGGGCTDGMCPVFQNIFRSFINTVYADDYGQPALNFKGGKMKMENCQFSYNAGMDVEIDLRVDNENQDDSLKIINSNFENNANNVAVVSNIYGSKINSNPNILDMFVLENNWYGSSAGPKFSSNSSSEGEELIGAVSIRGFSATKWELFSENSNVLFLPGIKASYLYKDGFVGEDQLWPPNYFGDDISELALNENGESLEDVYAREIIKELPVTGKNIYNSFAEKLKDLKDNRDINDFRLFAYDWRKNVEDIASIDAYFEDETNSVIGEFVNLAMNSQNKKVTIIAHSNGGLLAKALVQKLEELGRINEVDKIIFVGTPQMGTPLSVLSMLYGYDEASPLGILISQKEARKFAENMPGAYGLLPSEEYFNRLEEPLLDFSSIDSSHETQHKIFKNSYGENIGEGEFEEFQNFLTGKIDGREKPNENEIEFENVLRENLLEQAKLTHENLDLWELPENVKVIQIAGWGLDTISGIKYAEKEKINCYPSDSKIPACVETGEYESVYEPTWTVDGDAVVTAPSALMMPKEDDKIEKYWVDLYNSNKKFTIGRNHSDILEFPFLENFLENIISNKTSSSLPDYIYTSRPENYNNAKSRVRMSLYSPLDIHLYDEKNNHTGPKEITDEKGNKKIIFEEGIPNSYYQQFGERKYVGFSEGEKIRIEMKGYGDGAYTLKLEEVAFTENGEENILHNTFSNLPVSKNTLVTLEIPETGLADLVELKTDFDGDEEIDYTVVPVANGSATLNLDEISPEIVIISPENKMYLGNQNLEISYSVSDNISLSENIQIEIYLDNEKISVKNIDLAMLDPGEHRIKIIAIDEAKNKAEKEIKFSLAMNIVIFRDNVEKYFQMGLIKSKAEKNKLLAGIDLIQKEMAFLEAIRNNPFLKKNVKNLLLTIFEREIEKQFDLMIKKIQQDKKNYDLMIKNIIIEDLKWIKNNFINN